MPTVRIAERKVWVDDQPIPLISGEAHYWRLDPNSWRAVLQRVKEMGLATVATYVCWDFHEIAPGQYDFTGETDPRRNLLAFLDLLAEEGFWIILRPGPYIYSEWRNNGVPDHAAQYHRLDPTFLELAETYMSAVFQAVEHYLATRGGRIIVWQSDNEIDPWAHIYTEQLGLGKQVGPFHDFLRQRYDDVAALNDAWRTDFQSFDQARAVNEMFLSDPVLMARYNDFRVFLHWYGQKVAEWGIETYRNLGVDVPFLLNAYSGTATQHWSNLEKVADIVGPDIYPSREFMYRGGSTEHRNLLEAVRYTDAFSRLPYIPEFQSGIWHDWLEDVGYLPPNHYRLLCISALLAGSSGWNWYMLVNRDNWYQSPINEWGRTRPDLFNAFQQITSLYFALDPTTLDKTTRIGVSFDPLQRGTERPGQDLLQSFYQADIDYDFFDLSQDVTTYSIAFYAGGRWLSREGQARLVDYVESGGHLVCIGAYPHMDEHLQPLNLLNVHAPEGIMSAAPMRMRLSLFEDEVESAWVYNYDSTPGQAITVTRLPVQQLASEELRLQFDVQAGAQYVAGYTQTRGQGRLTILGIKPSPGLLLAVLNHVGAVIPSRSQTPDVSTALYQRDGDFYLLAANIGAEGKSAQVALAPEIVEQGKWTLQNLDSGEAHPADITTAGTLTINIPRKDGAVFRLSRGSL